MASKKGLQISSELTLPLSAVTSTMLVLGGKGMGKTNLGGVLVEEISAAGARWSVIDPMGVWWGLRHAADGVGKGIECLILGGVHGDIPIEPTGGAVVADLVADETVNVVIDISRKRNGEMWSIGERIRFMLDYGKQLYKRQGSTVNGRRREPICQVIDEIARFIPQTIRSNEDNVAACAGIWSAIVEEGRNVGIGVVMLTQRNARINKDVAELADVMFAFRTVGPKSHDAVMEWLGEHLPKQQLQSLGQQLRSLPVGSCLAVSPGWLQIEKVVPVRMRHTFDSSATPKPGESAKRVKGSGAVPDLALFAQRMKETIEREKDNNVTELKKRIRELEAKVAKPGIVQALKPILDKPREITERETAAIVRPFVKERQQIAREMERVSDGLTKLQVIVCTALNAAQSDLPSEPLPQAIEAPKRPDAQTPSRPAVPALKLSGVQASEPGTGAKLTGNALKIAGIAAGYAQRGEGISKKLLATLCGASYGGSFSARISEARTAGAIRTEGDAVYATSDGVAKYAGAFHAPETTKEVVALWRPKLSGVALQIFDHLVSLGGESIKRTDLAEAIGATYGGSFSARLSEVRSTGLLVESGGSVAVNRSLLFL